MIKGLGKDVMSKVKSGRPPRPIRVLAAVLEQDGKWLIARRKKAGRHGGRWEFPGGKIEPDETPEECLRRELREEFGVESRVGRFLGSVRSVSVDFPAELLAYKVFHVSGEFRLYDHDEIRWVRPAEIEEYDLAQLDRLLLAKIMTDLQRGTLL
jgi:8-oxo-dGTP diphosphatase